MININFIRGIKRSYLTGIDMFSIPILKKLEKQKKIKVNEIVFSGMQYGPKRFFYQFFWIPLKLMFSKADANYFIDQTWGFAMIYPIKNKVIVCHDILGLEKQKNLNLIERISYWITRISMKRLSYANRIIAVSQFSKNQIINKLGIKADKISVIYSPIDSKHYHPIKLNKKAFLNKYKIKTNKKIILHIGTEESRKNVDKILLALKILKDKGENYKFIKIGKPNHELNRKKNLEIIKKYNLDVTLLEDVPYDDIPKFYNIADLFVFPSEYEGFGRPPLEAMACGCPVISTDKTALNESVGNAAFILKNITPEDISKAIYNLIKDNKLKQVLIKKGFNQVKRFSLEKEAKKWEKMIIEKKNIKK